MPKESMKRILVLTIGLVLALCRVPASANSNPGPVWDDLKAASGYAHIEYSLEQDTRTYRLTVFNDSSRYSLCAFSIYPETRMYGVVPVQSNPAPAGWESTSWGGSLYSVGPTFGDIRSGFAVAPDCWSDGIEAKSSQQGFSFRWTTSQLPTKLAFGVQMIDSRSASFWAKCDASELKPPIPVPEASTLALFGSGGLLALVWQRRPRLRRAAT